jgi:hypothetical protein
MEKIIHLKIKIKLKIIIKSKVIIKLKLNKEYLSNPI